MQLFKSPLGHWINQTYNQLETMFFVHNYTTFSTKNGEIENMLLIPHGVCKKFISTNSTLKDVILTKGKVVECSTFNGKL